MLPSVPPVLTHTIVEANWLGTRWLVGPDSTMMEVVCTRYFEDIDTMEVTMEVHLASTNSEVFHRSRLTGRYLLSNAIYVGKSEDFLRVNVSHEYNKFTLNGFAGNPFRVTRIHGTHVYLAYHSGDSEEFILTWGKFLEACREFGDTAGTASSEEPLPVPTWWEKL